MSNNDCSSNQMCPSGSLWYSEITSHNADLGILRLHPIMLQTVVEEPSI